MQFPMHGNGSFNPSPGNGPPNQMHLPHFPQNHAFHTDLPPPPPPPVQQGHPTAYMYLPPPPPASSAPEAQLITMSGTTQSYTNLSYLYPTSQGETQTTHGSSQQFHHHHHLPPVSILPPPPPLPPGTMPPAQAFHPLPSLPYSVPSRSLEPPGMPLPPPPPRSSSSLIADISCEKPEAAKPSGIVLHHEGPVVEDVGSSKESSSPPLEKAENDSPSCTDPDIEMEDDITLPQNENPLNCDSDQVPRENLNTEQLTPRHISAETNSITGVSMNFQAEIPGSKPYAHLHQDTDDCSRQASSSPYSGRAKIVSDMYDPFVDGYEPASVRLDRVEEHEPVHDSYNVPKASISSNRPLNMEENNQGVDKQALSESDMTARLSVSSNKPPDVEENITGNDVGAVVSGDNDEFGENGREGNSHETGTPNSHNENLKASNNVREGDSTRKKSRENPNEKESSRSTKLFKVVLTKFVKDLLKPSWRQGNMSKEAFKTIVKRAVDKVSNSMEGRRIPKSRAKIDRYIDTSQHKLTKLVMGYVDKYVKV